MTGATTRRALFGQALVIGAAGALPLASGAHAAAKEAEFLRIMSATHPKGRQVALQALAAEMDPSNLRAILSPGGLFDSEDLRLTFYSGATDRMHTFGERGGRRGW